MKTAMSRCRVCGHKLFKKPLLSYKNLPKSAQHFPTAKSLDIDKGINLKICQCSGCSLVQLDREPVSYYQKVIRAAAISKEMKDFRLKQFKAFVSQYGLKQKKIIEIGCGRGEYLSLMQQCGVKAYGLEGGKESVDYCRKNGLKVAKGYIDHSDYELNNTPFDAFFMLNYLEHLPDPNAVLSGICTNLSDGAVGLVEVPNFDMMLRKKLFSEFIADHLFYFTKQTLKIALNINGFDILESRSVYYDFIISAVVKKRTKLDLNSFYQNQKKLEKAIQFYIEKKYQEKKVAIWGAGHLALTFLSLAKLTGKVTYVVDSAKFKQNKFTPATHIPIVSPGKLDSDPVDAVIVMAGAYSDEVAGIIRKNHPRIKIAILRDYGLELVKP